MKTCKNCEMVEIPKGKLDRLRAELAETKESGLAVVEECKYLEARVRELEEACREIEALGHGSGSGRGYTCADIAQKALANSEKEGNS